MISHLKLRLAASAFMLAAVLQPQAGHAQPFAARAATEATVTLPHISVTTMGRGSPVVLIPGLSSPREVWAGIAPELARTHRVILVQVNGFGGDAPGENLTPGMLDGIVADLQTYLTQRRLGPTDVIGHSMGGLVALMLAKAHPASARRLMIVDSLPYIGELFAPGATVAALEPQARAMRDTMAAGYGKPANAVANEATADRLALTPAARRQVVAWMARADARVTAQGFYEDMTTDLRPVMADIATPITVVYPGTGAPDDQGTALYRRAYAAAPNATYVPVPASAHFVMLDQPAAFAAAVRDFLK